MHVSSYDSVDQLPAAEWDALVIGGTIYSSSGFAGVRAEELPPEPPPAICWRVTRRERRSRRPRRTRRPSAAPALHPRPDLLAGLIDDERHAQLAARPMVFGAGWSEFRGQLPGREGVTAQERAQAVRALTAQADLDFARTAEADVLGYYYLPRAEALEVAEAHAEDGAVVLYHDVETVLPVGLWQSLDDYFAWLPSGRRPRARRERRDFGRSGRTIREVSLPEVVKEIAPLNSALMRKHGHAYGEEHRGSGVRPPGTPPRRPQHAPPGRGRRAAHRFRAAIPARRHAVRARGWLDYSVPNVADYFNLVFYHPVGVGRQPHRAGDPPRSGHLPGKAGARRPAASPVQRVRGSGPAVGGGRERSANATGPRRRRSAPSTASTWWAG